MKYLRYQQHYFYGMNGHLSGPGDGKIRNPLTNNCNYPSGQLPGAQQKVAAWARHSYSEPEPTGGADADTVDLSSNLRRFYGTIGIWEDRYSSALSETWFKAMHGDANRVKPG